MKTQVFLGVVLMETAVTMKYTMKMKDTLIAGTFMMQHSSVTNSSENLFCSYFSLLLVT